MQDNLSPAVERALEYADKQGFDYSSRDLLIGLLDEDGRVWQLLTQAGLKVERAAKRLHQEPREAFQSGGALLEQAMTVAFRTGQKILTSEDLFLHLIEADRTLLEFFQAEGANFDFLRTSVPAETPVIVEPEAAIFFEDPVEQWAAARAIDAGANRVRESLRVIDDYCRFALDDAFLSGVAKTFRHEFSEAMNLFPPELLISARDSEHDVGTHSYAAGEYDRASLYDVAVVNCKRLQESLRSLEEFAKIEQSLAAEAFEQFRYRAYTLERLLAGRRNPKSRLEKAHLYVLMTGSLCESSLEWTLREAAAGGAAIFQLREKELGDSQLLERAKDLRRWTRETNTLFIVNDRPDIARLAEADGVHLGQDDLPVKAARMILGPEAIIGVSTHNLEQVQRAIRDGANYLGVGPTFPSQTKSFTEFPGLEFARQAAAETTLPVFVIGGITPGNCAEVAAAGVRRVAVGTAITKAEEPREVARAILTKLVPRSS